MVMPFMEIRDPEGGVAGRIIEVLNTDLKVLNVTEFSGVLGRHRSSEV